MTMMESTTTIDLTETTAPQATSIEEIHIETIEERLTVFFITISHYVAHDVIVLSRFKSNFGRMSYHLAFMVLFSQWFCFWAFPFAWSRIQNSSRNFWNYCWKLMCDFFLILNETVSIKFGIILQKVICEAAKPNCHQHLVKFILNSELRSFEECIDFVPSYAHFCSLCSSECAFCSCCCSMCDLRTIFIFEFTGNTRVSNKFHFICFD